MSILSTNPSPCYLSLLPTSSYISLAGDLCVLDVSGNVSLGNSGTLRLLKACSSRIGGEDARLNLNMVACGMESPLPRELIEVVHLLRQRNKSEVDLFGNLIDRNDMSLLNDK